MRVASEERRKVMGALGVEEVRRKWEGMGRRVW